MGKLMVGHHPSSKMIIMPTKRWTVQGICSSGCLGHGEISTDSSSDIKVQTISMHHNNATSIKVRYTDESGTFKQLAKDSVAMKRYQPSPRLLPQPVTIKAGIADIVVDCQYDNANKEFPMMGGFGIGEESCFALLTYEGPLLSASVCTSVPTEITLETAYGFEL